MREDQIYSIQNAVEEITGKSITEKEGLAILEAIEAVEEYYGNACLGVSLE